MKIRRALAIPHLLLLCLVSTPLLAAMPTWFKDSFLYLGEEVANAAAEGKRVALYFHQEECPYCQRMLEVNFSQRDIVAKTQAQFNVIAFNIWGDLEVTDLEGKVSSEKDFARDQKVQFTPTILFLDEQGAVTSALTAITRRSASAPCSITAPNAPRPPVPSRIFWPPGPAPRPAPSCTGTPAISPTPSSSTSAPAPSPCCCSSSKPVARPATSCIARAWRGTRPRSC